jgi:hypothetical protein
MDAALEAFKAEASKSKEDGRDDEACVSLAEAYVLAHPELEHRFGNLSRDECVQEIDHYRALGREESLWQAKAWIRAHFEPQHIGGNGQMRVERRQIGGKR